MPNDFTSHEKRAANLANLAEVATHLQQIRKEERAHLARELHDELGAILIAAKLDVACLKAHLTDASPEITRRLAHLGETLKLRIALKSRMVEGLCPRHLQIWAWWLPWRFSAVTSL